MNAINLLQTPEPENCPMKHFKMQEFPPGKNRENGKTTNLQYL